MKKGIFFGFLLFALAIFLASPYTAHSQLKSGEPIILGVPTALGSIEGDRKSVV